MASSSIACPAYSAARPALSLRPLPLAPAAFERHWHRLSRMGSLADVRVFRCSSLNSKFTWSSSNSTWYSALFFICFARPGGVCAAARRNRRPGGGAVSVLPTIRCSRLAKTADTYSIPHEGKGGAGGLRGAAPLYLMQRFVIVGEARWTWTARGTTRPADGHDRRGYSRKGKSPVRPSWRACEVPASRHGLRA